MSSNKIANQTKMHIFTILLKTLFLLLATNIVYLILIRPLGHGIFIYTILSSSSHSDISFYILLF